MSTDEVLIFKMEEQPGDERIVPFSFENEEINRASYVLPNIYKQKKPMK